jgi:hypothetical protein
MDVTRIQPLVEGLDRLALPGTLRAADDHQDGELLRREQVVLGIEQCLAQRRHCRVVVRLADLLAQFC